MAAAQIFLRGDLLFPLEGRVGLGDKVRRGDVNAKAPFLVHGVFFPRQDHLVHQLRDAENILVRFRGQTQHKIELDIVPAAGKGVGTGRQNFVLGQIFVDDVPQALGSGLRCEGQAAFPTARLKPLHQVAGKIVRPEGGDGKADFILRAVGNQLVRQLFQSPVIGGGQAGNGDFVVSGGTQGLHSLTVQHLRAFLPHRAAGEARLTEPAAPDAAPEHLQICPVVDDLRGGDDHFCREIGVVQVFDNALCNPLGCTLQRHDGGKSAVGVVFVAIEAGDVHAGNFHDFVQEGILAPPLGLCPVVKLQNLHGDVLALAQREKVDKVRQRLRVEGADASGEHDVFQSLPVFGAKGDARQVQHIQDVGVRHFVANGKGDHVKLPDGGLAFQRPQGQGVVPHGLLHVSPGGEHALAPHAVHPVHDAVEDTHS